MRSGSPLLVKSLSPVALACALIALSSPVRADEPLSLHYDFTSNADFFATGAALAVDGPDGDGNVDMLLGSATTTITDADIPRGAGLRDAFLYWGGSIPDGDDCSDPQIDDTVTFTPPDGNSSEVVAQQCYCSDAGAAAYDIQLCRAPITNFIGQQLNGDYGVGDFDALIDNASTNNASFSVVIVYSAADLPARRIALYDGLLTMWNQGVDEETVVLDGLEIDTPPSGDLTWYALEGDAGGNIGEEGVEVTGNPGGLSLILQDQFNPPNNPMNGTINTTTPPQTDSVGVDIDQFDITDALTAADSSVDITYRGGADKYWIAYNIVGVNIFAPVFSLNSSKDWVLQNDVDMSGDPSVGDEIRYTIRLQNDGDAEGLVVLEDLMPPQVESWTLVSAEGGTDVSTDDTLAFTDILVEPDSTVEFVFDVTIAEGSEGSEMVNIAQWEAPPDGGAGQLEAPPVPIAGGMGDGDGDPDPGDGDGDPATGDGDGDAATTDSGSGSDSGDSDTETDSDTFGGTDTGAPGDLPGLSEDGCNCAVGNEGPAGLASALGLLGLLGLRRRRRS